MNEIAHKQIRLQIKFPDDKNMTVHEALIFMQERFTSYLMKELECEINLQLLNLHVDKLLCGFDSHEEYRNLG